MSNRPMLLTGSSLERNDDCACSAGAFVLVYEADPWEADQDCACAEHAFPLCAEQLVVDSYAQPPQIYVAELPHAFHLAFSPFAPHGPSVLNAEAWRRWQSFNQLQPLTQPIDRQLAAQQLITPRGQPPQIQAAHSLTLAAWLHVTNACNLDCPYCYVQKSSARMTEEVGRRALEKIFEAARQHGFRRVKIKYAGGEAALHFKLVRQLQAYARELAQTNNLDLRAVVLSNGTFWQPDNVEWLIANDVKLMISLDGLGAEHDRLRPDRRGGATFDRVAHTIDQILLPRGVRPDITLTITRLNAAGAADVVRWAMIERGLPLSLNFYRQPIGRTPPAELALEEAAIIEGMLAAYAVIEQALPLRPFFDGLLDRVQGEAHTHTCGVGQSYLVISHTGQVAQCQMHLENAINAASTDDILPLVAAGSLQNLSVEQKAGCRECTYRYYCAGGCPLETYRATGRWDVQSPNCRIYQTLLPAALRLEGLRLLKANGFLQ
ncbi:MAG TPA: radical SAM protein [Anaerolineae bacterium]|nr:radical SAM protein [Anaerolineae bacterium]